MGTRFPLSALLLLSVISVLIAPSINGQSYTTVTSYFTTTFYSRVLTVSSAASTITHVDQLSINPPSPAACGATKSDLIRGTPGGEVIVSLLSTRNIDFFVFASLDDYSHWEYGNPCDFNSVDNTLVKQQDVTSYVFHITLQHDVAVLAFLYRSHESSTADITVTQLMLRPGIVTAEIEITVISTVRALEASMVNVTETSKGGPIVSTGDPVVFGAVSAAIILTIAIVLYKLGLNKPKRKTPTKRKGTNGT